MENITKRMGEDSGEMDKLRRKPDEDSSEIRILEGRCERCERCESLQYELQKQTARFTELENAVKRRDALLDIQNASFVEKASELEMEFDPCVDLGDIWPEPTDAQGNKKQGELANLELQCAWLRMSIALEMRMEMATLFSLLDIEKAVYREKYRAGPGHLLLAASLKRIGFSTDDWELSVSSEAQDTTASSLSDKQIDLMKRIQFGPQSCDMALLSDQCT